MEKVFVILGSPQHKIALQAHIKEIEMTIASNQLSPNRMNDITRRDKFVAELAFLELHSPDPEPELDDAFGLEKYLTAESQDTESTDTTVIHATTETFGELTNMKFIDIVEERQELFMKPKVRQYFVDNVLYREEKERRVGWYELFVDLIFVGAISKAGHVIENSFTFDDLWNFSLVFACLYAQWSHFTQYQNMIYQDDLFQRVFVS